ncbi:MAG: hypothetical protein P8Z76_14700 [Alphaproteobacteria bacterium]
MLPDESRTMMTLSFAAAVVGTTDAPNIVTAKHAAATALPKRLTAEKLTAEKLTAEKLTAEKLTRCMALSLIPRRRLRPY